MTSESTSLHAQRRLLIIVAIVSIVALLITFAILFLDTRRIDRLGLEAEIARVAGFLMEERGRMDRDRVPERVRGYGIYDETGDATVRFGTAPARLPTAWRSRGPGAVTRIDDGVLQTARPLGATPPWVGNLLSDRRDRRMMQPRMPGLQRPPRLQDVPEGAGRADDPRGFVFLAYDVSHFILASRLRQLAALGVAVLIAVLGITTVLLFRRLQRLEAGRREHSRLVQLGQAARTLAHEIRNPLGAIRMQSALLRRKLGPETGDSLDVLDEEVGRINQLVDRVRDFLKNPRGNPVAVNLAEACQRLEARFGDVVTVQADEGSAALQVHIDPTRLASALDNITRNGIEACESLSATPPAPWVQVRLGKERKMARLYIQDSGPGISREQTGRLFEPFYTTKEGGSGIGLAISRRVIEAAGGQLTVDNPADGGARFVILLAMGK